MRKFDSEKYFQDYLGGRITKSGEMSEVMSKEMRSAFYVGMMLMYRETAIVMKDLSEPQSLALQSSITKQLTRFIKEEEAELL